MRRTAELQRKSRPRNCGRGRDAGQDGAAGVDLADLRDGRLQGAAVLVP
jgi:hypothetical protein